MRKQVKNIVLVLLCFIVAEQILFALIPIPIKIENSTFRCPPTTMTIEYYEKNRTVACRSLLYIGVKLAIHDINYRLNPREPYKVEPDGTINIEPGY